MALKKPHESRRAKYEEDPDLPVGYLSASAITTYLDCPYAFYMRYIMRVPKVVRAIPMEGTALHEVLEENNLNHARTGEPMPEKQMLEKWDDTWADTKKTIEWRDDDEKPDDIQGRGREFTSQYRKHYAARIIPVSESAVEEKFEVMVNGVPVIGFIDLRHESDGHPALLDYKVTSKTKSVFEVEKNIQMGVYALATGIKPVENFCFVKTKQPKIERVKTARTPVSLERTARVIESVAKAIKAGNFPFCAPDSWKCNEKWCDAWHWCPQGGKK